MKPICCNKPARPWRKEYGRSWVEAFKCKVCGHIGVPTDKPFDRSHMLAMDAVREAGMKWELENLEILPNMVELAAD